MKRILVIGTVVLLAAGQAGATVLDTWTQISTQFTNLGRAQATDAEVGVSTVTSTATSNHLVSLSLGAPAPGLSLDQIIPVTDPIVSIGGIVEVHLTNLRVRPDQATGPVGNISGAIASTAGGLTPSTIPLTGMVRICLVFTGCTGPFLPLDLAGTFGGNPAGVGVGGVLTIGGTGTIMVSIVGAPYTVKTVTAFNRTNNLAVASFMENGFAHGPGSMTSSTGQTSGVFQMISANHISIVGVPGNGDIAGVYTRVLVHFVPEPGLLVLLGSGALGLALLGRSRLRK